jgi:hypothetical protein
MSIGPSLVVVGYIESLLPHSPIAAAEQSREDGAAGDTISEMLENCT